MFDITDVQTGRDLAISDSIVAKAGNVVSTQLSSLEFAQDFGVDFKFFLESEYLFQTESFKAYLVERLVSQQVNVAQVMDTLDSLTETLVFYTGDVVDPSRPAQKGLIL